MKETVCYLLASASCFHVAHSATCGLNFCRLRQINNESGIRGSSAHGVINTANPLHSEREKSEIKETVSRERQLLHLVERRTASWIEESTGSVEAGLGWRGSVCLRRGGGGWIRVKNGRWNAGLLTFKTDSSTRMKMKAPLTRSFHSFCRWCWSVRSDWYFLSVWSRVCFPISRAEE